MIELANKGRTKKKETPVVQLDSLIVCTQCGWSGDEDRRIDLFCPECGNYIEARKIIEIRIHSNFGEKDELYAISLMFDDGTQTCFAETFQHREAEAFAIGIKEGIRARNVGLRLS